MTDRTTARDEMTALVNDNWDEVLLFDDKGGKVPGNEATWARLQVRHNLSGQASLANHNGRRRWTRTGILTVQLFTPAGDGLSKSDELVKRLLDVLEGATTASGVEFRNVRGNEVGPDGAWFQVNVLAEFRYDEVK